MSELLQNGHDRVKPGAYKSGLHGSERTVRQSPRTGPGTLSTKRPKRQQTEGTPTFTVPCARCQAGWGKDRVASGPGIETLPPVTY